MKRFGDFFLSGQFLHNRALALTCWCLIPLLGFLSSFSKGQINNYLIFRQVFFHLHRQQNLYLPYPAEYGDVNLYGPTFGVFVAPFSLLPVSVGVWCWVIFHICFLGFAISKLPLPLAWRTALLLLCSHEMMVNCSWVQTNGFICGCLLLGYAYVQKEKDRAGLFFILLATFIKVYGIVGLCFFFFSRRKGSFVLWSAVWSVVLFLLPVLFTPLSFLLQSYADWLNALQEKSNLNIQLNGGDVLYQNISVMGMIRRIFYLPHMNDLSVLVPGTLLLLSQGLAWRHFKDTRLQLYLLSSLLLFVVIFSNSAESPTYIIALPGFCIWYALQPKSRAVNWAFAFLFIFTTFAYTDLLGHWLRARLYRPYSLKALPSFILWLVILVQIHRRQFLKAGFWQPANLANQKNSAWAGSQPSY